MFMYLVFFLFMITFCIKSIKTSVVHFFVSFSFEYSIFSLRLFLDQRQPGPIKLVLLVIIGWLVGW